MKCLDTDFIVDVLRGRPAAHRKLGELENEQLAFTTITLFELLFGAKISSRKTENLAEVEKLIARLDLLVFDARAAAIASTVHAELREENRIKFPDLFIGSIALANNLKLVTRNKKDFSKINGLELENW